MLKLLLCIVFIISSALMGNCFSVRLTARRKCLANIIESIKKAKILMSFTGYDISRVISDSFFPHEKNLEKYEEYIDSTEAFSKLNRWVDDEYRARRINKEDREIISKFIVGLGVTDVEGQMSNCDMYTELLSERLNKARIYEEKNGKLYRILGLSLGCAVTLIML